MTSVISISIRVCARRQMTSHSFKDASGKLFTRKIVFTLRRNTILQAMSALFLKIDSCNTQHLFFCSFMHMPQRRVPFEVA